MFKKFCPNSFRFCLTNFQLETLGFASGNSDKALTVIETAGPMEEGTVFFYLFIFHHYYSFNFYL